MAAKTPTVRMRRLGYFMRTIRDGLDLNLDEAAALTQNSKSTLSRIENAQVVARPADIDYILWKYGVTDERLRAELLALAKGGRTKGWWQSYAGLTALDSDWISLEQDSCRIRGFYPIVIPGLLQIPEYARALMRGVPSRPGMDIERGVALRMDRQQILTRPDPVRLEAVLDESVLRRQIGADGVMQAQLRHLKAMAEQENVTVRILPLDAGTHPVPAGSFVALDVIGGDFTVTYLESLNGSSFVEDAAAVDRCIVAFDSLCFLALPDGESLGLIEQRLREL